MLTVSYGEGNSCVTEGCYCYIYFFSLLVCSLKHTIESCGLNQVGQRSPATPGRAPVGETQVTDIFTFSGDRIKCQGPQN